MKIYQKVCFIVLILFMTGCSVKYHTMVSPQFHKMPKEIYVVLNLKSTYPNLIFKEKLLYYVLEEMRKKYPNTEFISTKFNRLPGFTYLKTYLKLYMIVITVITKNTETQDVMPIVSTSTSNTSGTYGNNIYSGLTTSASTSYIPYKSRVRVCATGFILSEMSFSFDGIHSHTLWDGNVVGQVYDIEKNLKKHIETLVKHFGEDYEN